MFRFVENSVLSQRRWPAEFATTANFTDVALEVVPEPPPTTLSTGERRPSVHFADTTARGDW